MADKIQADLAKLDEEQVKMLKELCIQVNEQDEPIGPRSKVDLHVWENIISGEKLLHRAFSVFLINKENKLLLQQRAGSKITFPDYWANTCCSHPWHTEDEMERTNDLGVKRAAIRKLKQELGITNDQVPIDDFEFVTRIHYSAPCDDGKWGEHEIDHVLILRPKNDVIVKLNDGFSILQFLHPCFSFFNYTITTSIVYAGRRQHCCCWWRTFVFLSVTIFFINCNYLLLNYVQITAGIFILTCCLYNTFLFFIFLLVFRSRLRY